MDIVNIKAVEMYAKIVHIYLNVQKAKNHVKLITRHIWENYMEQCEDVRHTFGNEKNYMSKEKKPLNESLEQQRRIMVFVIHKCMVRLEWK